MGTTVSYLYAIIFFLLVVQLFLLMRHVLFKRELLKLKEDMKKHRLEKGFDNALWDMFISRTRTMLRFWR